MSDKKSEPTSPDITALQTELAAAYSALESQKAQIAQLEASIGDTPNLKARVDKNASYLSKLLAAKYEAAPDDIKARFPAETFEGMDPLDAIEQLDGATKFYTDMVASIKEKYNIKDAEVDPTKSAAKTEKPKHDLSSHRGLLSLAVSLGEKKSKE